jgi:hypothetical protein
MLLSPDIRLLNRLPAVRRRSDGLMNPILAVADLIRGLVMPMRSTANRKDDGVRSLSIAWNNRLVVATRCCGRNHHCARGTVYKPGSLPGSNPPRQRHERRDTGIQWGYRRPHPRRLNLLTSGAHDESSCRMLVLIDSGRWWPLSTPKRKFNGPCELALKLGKISKGSQLQHMAAILDRGEWRA